MSPDQIQLYKTCHKQKHQRFMLVIAVGVVAEIISIGHTTSAGAIVEQGFVPALIAIICFAIGILGIQKINKRMKLVLSDEYGIRKRILTKINKGWCETTAEFAGDTTLFPIAEIVGVIDVGDKVSLVHWKDNGKYSLVQLEYME